MLKMLNLRHDVSIEPVRTPYGPPSAFLQWNAVEGPKKGRGGAEGIPWVEGMRTAAGKRGGVKKERHLLVEMPSFVL